MINKLLAIQAELKVNKNQYNSFGKYYYRSCEDILEAVKPLCVKQGLLLTVTDEIIEVGNRIYVKAVSEITDGQIKISAVGYARESENKKGMDDSQITGSASSYARKYSLNGLFLIDDTKDADSTNKHEKDTDKPEQKNTKPFEKFTESPDLDAVFTGELTPVERIQQSTKIDAQRKAELTDMYKKKDDNTKKAFFDSFISKQI